MSHNPFVSDSNKNQVNIPESQLPIKPMTMGELGATIDNRIKNIQEEFKVGLDLINQYHKSVTFFGSARLHEEDKYYQKAVSLASLLSENGYAVTTGGGPGIMEAANKGAYLAGGPSIGLTIELPNEQAVNPYVTAQAGFYYFFTRKVCLSFSAEAYVYFPGGFGTLDEFFEIITLVQTKKIPKVPIILVGKEFWQPLHDFIQNVLSKHFKTIDQIDMNLYHILDDEKTIVDLIKMSPVRFDG